LREHGLRRRSIEKYRKAEERQNRRVFEKKDQYVEARKVVLLKSKRKMQLIPRYQRKTKELMILKRKERAAEQQIQARDGSSASQA
jgi:hypothetical protein